MLKSSCFMQECPVCGRPAKIRLEYRGCRVECQHCRGQFVASDCARATGRRADRRQPVFAGAFC